MFRTKFLYGMAAAIVIVYLCLMVAPLSAQTEDLDRPPRPVKKGIPGLESVLSDLLNRFESTGVVGAAAFAKKRRIKISAGRIRVIAEMESEEQARRLRLPGATVEATHRNLVRLSVPLGLIRALVAIHGVKFVREPLKPLPHAGEVTSEGVATTGADTWHDAGATSMADRCRQRRHPLSDDPSLAGFPTDRPGRGVARRCRVRLLRG